MKKYLSFIMSLLIILSISVFAYAADTSIICIGDSLTLNEDNALYNYPFYLDYALDGYSVYNCAKNDATIGSYLTSDEYTTSLTYDADKIIIMFGTDDTVSGTDTNSFYTSYSSLIDSYSASEIILMLPPVVSDELKAEAVKVAGEKNLRLIDLKKTVSAENIYETYYVNDSGAKQIKNEIVESFELDALGLKLDIDVINKLDKSGNSENTELNVKNIFNESETVDGKEIDYAYFNKQGYSYFNAKAATVISGEGNFSAEMWVNITNSDENDRLLFAVAPNNLTSFENTSFYVSVNGNNMTVSSGGETSVVDITAYADKWVHWVIERNYDADNGNVNINLYADTQKVGETIVFEQTKADETEMKIYFGGMGTNRKKCSDNIFRGYLAEARVYDSALSSDIVTEIYNKSISNFVVSENDDENEEPPIDPDDPSLNPEEPEKEKGMIFELEIPDDLNGDFKDNVDETVTVTKNGSTTVETYNGVGGSFNYASFDNTSKNAAGWLTVDVKNIINSKDLTFEFWIRPEDHTPYGGKNWGNMFLYSNDANPTYSMMRIGWWGNSFQFTNENNGNNIRGDASYVGKWTHIVYQRSYNTEDKQVSYIGYINGNQVFTQIETYDEITVESEVNTMLGIGGITSNMSHAYKGDVSEFRVYNMLLSDSEIKSSYKKDLERHTDFTFNYKGTSSPARDSESIILDMTPGFSALDALKGPIVITEDDKDVAAQVTATDESKFTLTFNRYIKYGASFRVYSEYLDAYNYLIFDKGVINASLVLYDENIDKIESVGEQNSLLANINIKNSGSSDKKVKYSLLAKKSDGVVSDYKTDELTISDNKNLYVNLSNTQGVEKVILYVWEIEDTKLIPVYDIPIIID